MASQFEWTISETEDDDELLRPPTPRQRKLNLWLLVPLLFVGIAYGTYRIRLNQLNNIARSDIQALLNTQSDAVMAGDVELYLSLAGDDPALRAQRLRAEQQAMFRSRPEIVDLKLTSTEGWATVGWEDDTGPRETLLFFRAKNVREWEQVASSSDFYGLRSLHRYEWGIMALMAADLPWQEALADHVAQSAARLCATSCQQLYIEVMPDWTLADEAWFFDHPTPWKLRVPSPHLFGIDDDGMPSAAFWEAIDTQIAQLASPSAIRFAVPNDWVETIEKIAADYATHPIDVVGYAEPFALPSEAYDAAIVQIDEQLVTSGAVHDLSDFVLEDANFVSSDVDRLLWDGVVWNERVWAVPLSAEMRLIFYNRAAYDAIELPYPTVGWTIDRMARDAARFGFEQPGAVEYGLVANHPDLLFNRAFATQAMPATDLDPFQESTYWYQALEQRGTAAPLSSMPPSDRAQAARNLLGYPWEVGMWVGSPTLYEHFLQYAPLGVAPLPTTEQPSDTVPLRVNGMVISQASERPHAVWAWLDHLSRQPLPHRWRQIPARQSVTEATEFWPRLPRPIGDVMRASMPLARPITPAEQAYFDWVPAD